MNPRYEDFDEIELDEYTDSNVQDAEVKGEYNYGMLEEIELEEYEDSSSVPAGSDDLSEEGLGETTIKRRLASQNRDRIHRWKQEMNRVRRKNLFERLLNAYHQSDWARRGMRLLFPVLIALVLLVLWLSFEYSGANVVTWGRVKLYLVFRLFFFMLMLIIVLIIIVQYVLWAITKIVRERIVVQYSAFTISISFFIWAIICLSTYQQIGGGNIARDCHTSRDDATTDSTGTVGTSDNPWAGSCFTFHWLFLSILIISILYFIRSVLEEILLAKLGIRPTSMALKVALLKEYSLSRLVRLARYSGALPKRHEPTNQVPDLSLRLFSPNESTMIDILSKKMKNIQRYEIPSEHFETAQLRAAVKEQAGQLFDFYIPPGESYLTKEHFAKVMNSEKSQKRAFLAFDSTLSGRLDRDEFIAAVNDIYFSRRTTWFSYIDRRELSRLLRFIFGIVFWLVMIILALLLADVSFDTVIVPFASFLLGFSFAFGSLVGLMANSFVLTLVVRPFDIGDLIHIGNTGDRWEVVKIGLFRTLLRKTDGRYTSFPNTILVSDRIINLSKSDNATFWTSVVMSFDGSISSIIALKNVITEYLENNPDFNPSGCLVWIERIEDTNYLQFWASATFAHVAWSDRGSQEEIKFEFILFLQKEAKKLGIKLVKPTIPVTMNSRDIHSEESRKRAESMIRKNK